MAYIIGLILMVVGLALGLFGEREGSQVMMILGGFFITAGITTVLLNAGARGGRGDEPGGHIRP